VKNKNYTFTPLDVRTSIVKTVLYQLNSLIMNAILGLGKYLFAVPFAIFGIFHFMGADAMAAMTPGGAIMVYFTGICLIAAAVSIIIGKFDKLATALLGLMLLLFVVLVHAKGLSSAADEMAKQTAMGGLLKDLALAGAAWMYSASMSKDNSVIG
jgi:putative oxidoreductase